jgi:hypothetical protein
MAGSVLAKNQNASLALRGWGKNAGLPFSVLREPGESAAARAAGLRNK